MAEDLKQSASDTEVGTLWYILRAVIVMFLILFVFLLLNGWSSGFMLLI